MTSVLAPVYSARDVNVFTSRLSSTSLLCIDSNDRFKNNADTRDETIRAASTAYDFQITKNESLMNGFFTRLGVTEVMFQWMVPNINFQTSIVGFDYQPAVGPAVAGSISLDVGFYTPSMIASEIQALVRAIDVPNLGAFTMTYGVDNAGSQAPIFRYDTNNATTVRFYPYLTSPAAGVNANSRQLFDILGFTTPTNTTLDLGGVGYATYCQATRYVDIVCSQLTNQQSLKDTMSQIVARDVLCRLYLSDSANSQSTVLPSSATFCPAGCMPTTLYKNFSQPKQIQWIPSQPVPGALRFEVFDEDGNNLNQLSDADEYDGANWAISILVSEN